MGLVMGICKPLFKAAAPWIIAAGAAIIVYPAQREFLTPLEVTKIQDAQEIEERINIYMEAAILRLKNAEERLSGKESAPGDPMEFYSVADMLDGYYRIVRSVMFNIDDAFQAPKTEKAKLGKALKNLKTTMERATKDLQVLKRIAEDKKLEEVWNLTNKAIDITKGALEGAEVGLSTHPAPGPPKKKAKGGSGNPDS
jgi:hypothetical protein